MSAPLKYDNTKPLSSRYTCLTVAGFRVFLGGLSQQFGTNLGVEGPHGGPVVSACTEAFRSTVWHVYLEHNDLRAVCPSCPTLHPCAAVESDCEGGEGAVCTRQWQHVPMR